MGRRWRSARETNSTDPEGPTLGQAFLDSTDVSVLVDEDGDPIALGPDLATDGPHFPKSGHTVLDALSSDAQRRIADLHEASARHQASSDVSEGDRRLDWRVIRWMPTEADAQKFAAKLASYEDIGSAISVVNATIVNAEELA